MTIQSKGPAGKEQPCKHAWDELPAKWVAVVNGGMLLVHGSMY